MTCNLGQFLILVQRQARRTTILHETFRDPEGAARVLIDRNPDTTESRLLGRLLEALKARQGTFREAEVYVLGPETLPIASALVERALLGLE